MDENYWNKIILCLVGCIIAYYVLQMVLPYLIWGLVGLVVWRVVQEYQKHKR
jgi:hypothetical protein